MQLSSQAGWSLGGMMVKFSGDLIARYRTLNSASHRISSSSSSSRVRMARFIDN